jgi:hypothetical protein
MEPPYFNGSGIKKKNMMRLLLFFFLAYIKYIVAPEH